MCRSLCSGSNDDLFFLLRQRHRLTFTMWHKWKGPYKDWYISPYIRPVMQQSNPTLTFWPQFQHPGSNIVSPGPDCFRKDFLLRNRFSEKPSILHKNMDMPEEMHGRIRLCCVDEQYPLDIQKKIHLRSTRHISQTFSRVQLQKLFGKKQGQPFTVACGC